MRNNFLLLSLAMTSGVLVVHGQSITPQVISSSGGYGQTVQSNLSWTVGEPLVSTISNANNTLTQGFHQPNLQIVTKSESGLSDSQVVMLYPNPAVDELVVQLKTLPAGNNYYRLFDAGGNLVKEQLLNSTSTKLILNDVASGHYVVEIVLSNENAKAYKIIKNK